ncbi:four helix bundle protein [Bacteroidota bacterium]
MAEGNHWKDLIVWKRGHAMVIKVYSIINDLPDTEKYSLKDQIRRSAISVPTNIVEGHARQSKKEFLRFLYISRGSLEELRYLFLLSKDLEYISEEKYTKFEEDFAEISYLLNKLIQSL